MPGADERAGATPRGHRRAGFYSSVAVSATMFTRVDERRVAFPKPDVFPWPLPRPSSRCRRFAGRAPLTRSGATAPGFNGRCWRTSTTAPDQHQLEPPPPARDPYRGPSTWKNDVTYSPTAAIVRRRADWRAWLPSAGYSTTDLTAGRVCTPSFNLSLRPCILDG